MIDRNNTAGDWAVARTDLLILPVGAFEQHGPHLPMDTDCRIAEYFSRILAERFNGALLPVQAIASSLEHTGWRGSFTLRPETLMAVIRDIAETAEMQNYRTLIIVNGHGGNFPLGPVCREWNRHDRKLKLLPVYPFGYAHAMDRPGRMDLHAGENETSVMMHLCGREFPLPESIVTGNTSFLRQSDLNTFGIGCLNPSGLPGHPEDASAERGEMLVKKMTEGIIQEVSERLELLRRNRRYSGTGGLYLRPCISDDLPELPALSESVHWNQTAADWERFLKYGQVWSMIHLNRIVASAAWIPRGRDTVWIGMVITQAEWRGCSIARRLLEKILSESAAYPNRYLDATAAGEPLYRMLGFDGMYKLYRMTGECLAAADEAVSELQPIKVADLPLPGMAAADPVLPDLVRNYPDLCRKDERRGLWLLGRPGAFCRQIGPVHADDVHDALAAVKSVLRGPSGKVIIDVPEYQQGFMEGLTAMGFSVQREFLRMRFRQSAELPKDPHLFASAGPEFG